MTVHTGADDGSWKPQLIALDIDGTLVRWTDDLGPVEHINQPVLDAVRRAYDAGVHVVLSSGRSTHGMVRTADMLGLPVEGADRLWMVASNGAVIVRYPPVETVHEVFFDAREAVAAVLAAHPSALVAVEERSIGGYRLNREFPTGELHGQMILSHVDDLVARPVSRVIIRDPEATQDDFAALAASLGLHGTDYVVGWSAWLDLSPVGVNKASGLQYVADQLGVDPAYALAIGDGNNDLEMLAWAGRGVAMGQARPEVKAAADGVTASVDDDGVAVELGRWIAP